MKLSDLDPADRAELIREAAEATMQRLEAEGYKQVGKYVIRGAGWLLVCLGFVLFVWAAKHDLIKL